MKREAIEAGAGGRVKKEWCVGTRECFNSELGQESHFEGLLQFCILKCPRILEKHTSRDAN